MLALHLLITGTVQGVFFRASTQQKAVELGLTGWVRNTDDGKVEVHAEGDEDSLSALQEWCQYGPKHAQVEKCDVQRVEEEGYGSFEINN